MTFSLIDSWVWDFWTAVDGDVVHLFYLHAPKSLINPDLRHRNASIGHATSTDFVNWVDHGVVLERGNPGAPDESATWTGSLVRDPGGGWRMYYTGSRFLSPQLLTNVETVLTATSADLHHWHKDPAAQLSASPPWYETLDDQTWHEEAWRDPWVVEDPAGDGWHMLVTARARNLPRGTDPRDRGVLGHAVSPDLRSWTLTEPITAPGAGFAHLEVPQLVTVQGRETLIFSCDASHLAGRRAGAAGGIWAVALDNGDRFGDSLVALDRAHRITGDELYAGRIVHTAEGPALIGFEKSGVNGAFVGRLSDPRPVRWDEDSRLVAT